MHLLVWVLQKKKMRRNTAPKRGQVTKSTGTPAMSSRYLPGLRGAPEGSCLQRLFVCTCLYVSTRACVCVVMQCACMCIYQYVWECVCCVYVCTSLHVRVYRCKQVNAHSTDHYTLPRASTSFSCYNDPCNLNTMATVQSLVFEAGSVIFRITQVSELSLTGMESLIQGRSS